MPIYERLGLRHDLLVARTNLAILYLERKQPGDRDFAEGLLRQAVTDAEVLRIPEAGQIREIMRSRGLAP